jgi:hypothetical protein
MLGTNYLFVSLLFVMFNVIHKNMKINVGKFNNLLSGTKFFGSKNAAVQGCSLFCVCSYYAYLYTGDCSMPKL